MGLGKKMNVNCVCHVLLYIKKCAGDDAGHIFAYICFFDLTVILPALCVCF